MSFEVIDYNNVNVKNIHFEVPKKMKGGSYISEVKYNIDGKLVPLVVQTPKLLSSAGIVKNELRTTIDLQFDKGHTNFYDFILDIDENNINNVEKNSEQWFNQKFPLDVVEEFYKSPIILGRGNTPPRLKLKIPTVKGNIDCIIFNKNKEKILHTDIEKDNKIVTVLQLSCLRFLRQQVICEWVPLQLMVLQGNSTKYIIDDSLLSDNEEILETERHVDEIIDNVSDDENSEIKEIIENVEPLPEPESEVVQEQEVVQESLPEPEVVQESLPEPEVVQEPLPEPEVVQEPHSDPEPDPEPQSQPEPELINSTNILENNEEIDSILNIQEFENTEEEIDYKILSEGLQKEILELKEKIQDLENTNNNNLTIIEKFKSLLSN